VVPHAPQRNRVNLVLKRLIQDAEGRPVTGLSGNYVLGDPDPVRVVKNRGSHGSLSISVPVAAAATAHHDAISLQRLARTANKTQLLGTGTPTSQRAVTLVSSSGKPND
jgi:hypothetical protein